MKWHNGLWCTTLESFLANFQSDSENYVLVILMSNIFMVINEATHFTSGISFHLLGTLTNVGVA